MNLPIVAPRRPSLVRRAVAAAALLLVAAVLAVLGAPGPLAAQDGLPVVTVSAKFDPAGTPAGGTAVMEIRLSIAPGWHLYPPGGDQDPPSFKWEGLPEGVAAGALEFVTKPHEIESFGQKSMAFDGELVLRQPFTIAASVAPGELAVKGSGGWMRCDEGNCTWDKKVPVSATLVVRPAAGAVPAPGGQEAPTPAGGGADGGNGGGNAGGIAGDGAAKPSMPMGDLLWKAFLAGLITLLTPCVFPMLPVTISFFSKQKGPALPRALVYSFGIVFTITALGIMFGSALDKLAAGWVFNACVGTLFLILAFSLFGGFDLKLPGFIVDYSTEKSGSGGHLGAFFMAVTLALTSFSCSAPFLALMLQDFQGGDKARAVTGLLVYSGTMAAPFFLCALFPAALRALPRAGAWMNAVKVTMGFVELALAFKFLRAVALYFDSDALPRNFVIAIWVACHLGAALYLFGYLVLPHDSKAESIGVVRMLFGVMFLAIAVYLVPGVFRKPLAPTLEAFILSKPDEIEISSAGGGSGKTAHLPWRMNDWEGTRAAAKLSGKPLLIDFTGFA
ncbi:MAG: Thiol:disulfide interchange protein DsbD [Planctomycetes bacterium]|nr:Thiol:disulfide interchange protein DsbD [Planctomycetota bacterium]